MVISDHFTILKYKKQDFQWFQLVLDYLIPSLTLIWLYYLAFVFNRYSIFKRTIVACLDPASHVADVFLDVDKFTNLKFCSNACSLLNAGIAYRFCCQGLV